jgi:ATP-dependent exoDNAse (exonuclease V) beta subunit
MTKTEADSLNFGRKIHRLLETFNFNDIEKSLLKLEPDYRHYLDGLLKDPLFCELDQARIYQELPFVDIDGDTEHRGVIDLLIEKKDVCYIIDYKLKDIDDLAYKNQLEGYKTYIEKTLNKPVETYLYSLIDQKMMRIGG